MLSVEADRLRFRALVDDACASRLEGRQHHARIAGEEGAFVRTKLSRRCRSLHRQERMAVTLGLVEERLGSRVVGEGEAARPAELGGRDR